MNLLPLVSFQQIELEDTNTLLELWGHKMGPINRPFAVRCYGLLHESDCVAIAVHACLIRDNAGGLDWLTRRTAIELARLCACRAGLCRVALRLWREFVFAALPYQYAVSYQDADLHNGNTYRFDGWRHVADSSSGTDLRSGKKGRRKRIWVWSQP